MADTAPGADVVLTRHLLGPLNPRRFRRVPPRRVRQGLAVQARIQAKVAQPIGELLPGALDARRR